MKKIIFFIYALLQVATLRNAQAQVKGASEDLIRQHVYFLASDKLKGRAPGTESEKLAANYIKKQFKKYKLKPGNKNTWFQPFEYTQSANPHASATEAQKRNGMNVIAWIDNQKPETVVIGAHFDHLGTDGEHNSLEKDPKGKIHYGADDNASGVASLLELSRLIAGNHIQEESNFLFIAFSAEEAGLIGSKFFVENTAISLKSIKAMLNMDMVGRLVDSSRRLIIAGYGTAPEWHGILTSTNQGRFKLTFDSAGLGPSDHASFYKKNIPVLHFFTGTHSDYHKSSDTPDKINYPGLTLITDYIYEIALAVASTPMHFSPTRNKQQGTASTFKVTLGIMPDYAFSGEGVKIDGVTEGRPAMQAGIKEGDVLIKLGEYTCKNIYEYMHALSKFAKGQTVEATLLRQGQEFKTFVTF